VLLLDDDMAFDGGLAGLRTERQRDKCRQRKHPGSHAQRGLLEPNQIESHRENPKGIMRPVYGT